MYCLPVYECNIFIIAFAPHITVHPTDLYAAAPFSGEFTCSATGCGYLNIIWYREAKPIPEKAHLNFVSSENKVTHTLIIPNVSGEDIGRYYCVVWANITATRSRVANLFLAGKVYV